MNEVLLSQGCWVSALRPPSISNFSSHAIVIGLTGGIATGKSTVSRQLAARNIPVIDADILARDVVRPGTQALNKIVSTFGPDILKEDGTLDRTKLGFIVFQDEEQRRKLNAIVHPAVRSAMILRILKYWLRGERVCVLDVPLLIESKIYQWVGKVVVVYWFVPFESHMTGSLMTGCEQLCRNTAAATHAAGWIDARGRTSAITGAASYRRQTRVC